MMGKKLTIHPCCRCLWPRLRSTRQCRFKLSAMAKLKPGAEQGRGKKRLGVIAPEYSSRREEPDGPWRKLRGGRDSGRTGESRRRLRNPAGRCHLASQPDSRELGCWRKERGCPKPRVTNLCFFWYVALTAAQCSPPCLMTSDNPGK